MFIRSLQKTSAGRTKKYPPTYTVCIMSHAQRKNQGRNAKSSMTFPGKQKYQDLLLYPFLVTEEKRKSFFQ